MDLLEKYELYACFQCGKCTGGCAVSLRTPLNIRVLIRNALLFGPESVLSLPEIWDCTTCANCTLRCPRGLKPSEFIIGLRSQLVEMGKIPKTAVEALEGTYRQGNPWGRARSKRTEWIKDGVRTISEGERISVLYFVGCAPSYDPRLQRLPRILCLIFEMMGLDYGVLGVRETCCGNEIRRMGEEGLFEMLMEENSENFASSGANTIVTTSPHCFNAFKNEYKLDGIEVLHYTQFISKLIEEGKLRFKKDFSKKVIYHDPCFLGKQNGVFDPPRNILSSIPGLELLEFERNREISLCCEGGGGRMWVEGSEGGKRNSEIRVEEALDKGAEVIATACPFCLLNLEDGLKTTGLDEKMKVMDILEIISESLDLGEV